MFKGIIRKADILLLIVLVGIGVTSSVFLSRSDVAGSRVIIEQDGETYGSYSLSEDRTIQVESDGKYNTVVIQDGQVRVSAASCHNQVCVNHAPISTTGESIICLPNKMIVKITGKGDGYDAISG